MRAASAPLVGDAAKWGGPASRAVRLAAWLLLLALPLAALGYTLVSVVPAPVPAPPPPPPPPAPPAPAEDWVCSVCGHVYDAAKDGGGQPFEKLPDTWKCPICGAAKSAYKLRADGRWVHEHAPGEGAEGPHAPRRSASRSGGLGQASHAGPPTSP